MATNQGFKSLVPGPDLDSRFLFWAVKRMAPAIAARGNGATFKEVSKSVMADIELQFPQDVDEQRRIAAILDKADAIRRKRRQALAEIDSLLRATFLDMFGDPATNPFGFDIQPVEQGLSEDRSGTQSGPFGSALKKHEYVRAGIPVWGIDNVQDGRFVREPKLFISPQKFEQLQRYSVQPRDILISRAGTVGRMCIADPPVAQSIISTNLVRVALNEEHLLPEYLCTLFTTFPDRLARLKSNKKENAFTFLNPGTLRAIEIPFPPPDRQLDFRRRVEMIQALRDRLDRDLKDANELFGSLSQRAFRGEL